jgi:DNA repair exonuclease SbcCD ATPase subunit
MSLSRKFLSAMGIEGDKIDEIINAHAETVDALKQERDEAKANVEKYKADADKLVEVQKELKELQKQVKETDPFKEKYESLKAEYDQYKTDIEAKETSAKKQTAYKDLLKKAKISEKYLDLVMKASADAINGLKFTEDGKVDGEDDVLKAIKEEHANLVEVEGTKGAETSTPPANNGGTAGEPSRASRLVDKYYEEHYGKKEV